ncbi:hypothetical protein Dsin_011714 [Dipteronia sinensis]|uniref:Uncharacterized protein n=1 Tax=Dipteronia sinensis TaxID=43782 RepID=A0AAE0AI07_9ROSI|nr:hypothetical protein Dsin_011714 [Dipteronia sinensis]
MLEITRTFERNTDDQLNNLTHSDKPTSTTSAEDITFRPRKSILLLWKHLTPLTILKTGPTKLSSSSAVYEPDVAPGGCLPKTEGQNGHNEDGHMSSASNDLLACEDEAQKKSDNISYLCAVIACL